MYYGLLWVKPMPNSITDISLEHGEWEASKSHSLQLATGTKGVGHPHFSSATLVKVTWKPAPVSDCLQGHWGCRYEEVSTHCREDGVEEVCCRTPLLPRLLSVCFYRLQKRLRPMNWSAQMLKTSIQLSNQSGHWVCSFPSRIFHFRHIFPKICLFFR